jgi:diguanylate cyclase
MRYSEDRESSAEILRLALAYMGRQPAALNPCTFALWYEHCAGLNPTLSQILDAKLAGNSPVTDQDVWRLYTEHIGARDARQCETVRDELYRILEDTAANTQQADQKAAEFDQALTTHTQQLATTHAPQAVQETVADLLSDTGKMRAMTAELSAKLKASTAEVSVLTENLRQAQAAALLDPLTGLRNRRGFEESMNEMKLQRGRLDGTALLMADIDHFKVVNDMHGHLLGDKVLRAVAHVLKSNIKGRDMAARLGGEEFAVILPDTSAEGAAALAKQIRSRVAHGRIKRSAAQGQIGQVTLSIGVAVAEAGESLESLMQRADAALYAAKQNGRNRVEVAPRRQASSS